MVGGHGRDSAEVINAKGQEACWLIAEIRGSLQMDVVWQNQTGGRNGPEKLFLVRWRLVRHGSLWLGQKVLNDDFLHVSKLTMGLSNGPQGLKSVGSILTNSNQQTSREGNL
jgi:hypothetical protein